MGTSHKITAIGNDRDRVLLNRGRGGVSSVLDILEQDGVDRGVGKFSHRFGNALTADFDGDIGVLVKVDTGGLNSARQTGFSASKKLKFWLTWCNPSPTSPYISFSILEFLAPTTCWPFFQLPNPGGAPCSKVFLTRG